MIQIGKLYKDPRLTVLHLVFAPAVLAACGHSPAVSGITISVVPDTVALEIRTHSRGFTAAAIIRNGATRPAYVSSCGASAFREIDGEWEMVWSPICLGSGSSVVNPADSLVVPILVSGVTLPGYYPAADDRLAAGLYRLHFALFWGIAFHGVLTEPLPDEGTFSSTFVVVQEDDQ